MAFPMFFNAVNNASSKNSISWLKIGGNSSQNSQTHSLFSVLLNNRFSKLLSKNKKPSKFIKSFNRWRKTLLFAWKTRSSSRSSRPPSGRQTNRFWPHSFSPIFSRKPSTASSFPLSWTSSTQSSRKRKERAILNSTDKVRSTMRRLQWLIRRDTTSQLKQCTSRLSEGFWKTLVGCWGKANISWCAVALYQKHSQKKMRKSRGMIDWWNGFTNLI